MRLCLYCCEYATHIMGLGLWGSNVKHDMKFKLEIPKLHSSFASLTNSPRNLYSAVYIKFSQCLYCNSICSHSLLILSERRKVGYTSRTSRYATMASTWHNSFLLAFQISLNVHKYFYKYIKIKQGLC